jgi:hypothetical protein
MFAAVLILQDKGRPPPADGKYRVCGIFHTHSTSGFMTRIARKNRKGKFYLVSDNQNGEERTSRRSVFFYKDSIKSYFLYVHLPRFSFIPRRMEYVSYSPERHETELPFPKAGEGLADI